MLNEPSLRHALHDRPSDRVEPDWIKAESGWIVTSRMYTRFQVEMEDGQGAQALNPALY